MAFAVALGVAALIATGGISRIATSSTPHQSAPRSTAKFPPFCGAQAIELVGARDDCATRDPAGAACSVAKGVLDAVIRLRGNSRSYLLYVEVDGGYSGTGPYLLPPWLHPYPDANDGNGKAGIRESVSGALWQSVAGVIIVTNKDGKSGVINAELDAVGGPGPPVTRLHIEGPWNCNVTHA
ncbi:MAG TPA: hypothetical protein VNY76_05725 [Candidatus Acidoferrales bacterium]|nr:hypothetical protein [Candidatus Acidoferrales bacterium]